MDRRETTHSARPPAAISKWHEQGEELVGQIHGRTHSSISGAACEGSGGKQEHTNDGELSTSADACQKKAYEPTMAAEGSTRLKWPERHLSAAAKTSRRF